MEYADKRAVNQSIIILTAALSLVLVLSWTNWRASPAAIFQYLGAEIGSTVGMKVGVPENPFNSLAQQLQEKEEQLNEKEVTLDQRETEMQGRIFAAGGNVILVLILVIVMLLFFLIMVNFYLDYRERKKNK